MSTSLPLFLPQNLLPQLTRLAPAQSLAHTGFGFALWQSSTSAAPQAARCCPYRDMAS